MVKDETYYFHQTPSDLCKELIELVPLEPADIVLEPFKGEGGFFNNFPDFVKMKWCEIEDGKDYKDFTEYVDDKGLKNTTLIKSLTIRDHFKTLCGRLIIQGNIINSGLILKK